MQNQGIIGYFESTLACAKEFEEYPNELRKQVAAFINRFCVESPPRASKRDGFESIVVTKTRESVSAKSQKPRNMVFNLVGVLETIAAGAFTVSSMVTTPWLIPFGLLLVWRSTVDALSIEISEREAIVLLAMWESRDEDGISAFQDILKCVNDLLKTYSRDSWSSRNVEEALKSLAKLGCVDQLGKESCWKVIEKLTVSHS